MTVTPEVSQNLLKRLKAPEYNDRLYVLPSPKALIMESQLMNNCVATYVDRVQTGRCIVSHYVSDNQSATVEVSWRRNKLHLQQMLGPGNRALAHEHLQFIRDILASVEGGESIGH